MTAEFEKFKDAARKQFGSATAFRVGIVVGRQGGNPLHPYPAGSGRLKSYLDGLAFGAEQREKAAKETSMQAEQQILQKMLSIYVEQLREKPSLGYVRLTMVEAERLIAALSHPSTPQGWKLVPVEPTADMLKATGAAYETDAFGARSAWPSDIYKAMVKASPPPPEQGGKG